MGNFVGDLIFSDNVNRRKRAGELHDDIVAFGAEVQRLNNERAQIVASLKPKVDALLVKHDIDTPEKLNARLVTALNSAEMQKYNDLKSRLDASDDFQTILLGLIDIGAVVTGVVIVGLAFAGVVTAGAAFAAVGEVLLVLGAIVAIVGVFEGAEERDELRKAISDLFPKRQEVRLVLGQLTTVVNWMKTIEIWVDKLSSDSGTVDILTQKTLKEEYDSWTVERTRQILAELDQSRGSWMNEDPGHEIQPDLGTVLNTVNPFRALEDLKLGSFLDSLF
ncbi:hypothetical protein QBC34DRAFT_436856 [Podospora aff. communis PSN243]|uniref:SMODS and SLOG-associating 2TM effector domain-containing protein n=1 Tax=Podospora aff. communis PSN243 TaxID=3040156 RepID=A0AAV9GRI3_9PEZI|nr:hypothetical protein QBC34DRAFT_436856 [Podospora aff. communis PSN243]